MLWGLRGVSNFELLMKDNDGLYFFDCVGEKDVGQGVQSIEHSSNLSM